MDEPASALDPISTQQIEDTIAELKDSVTIVIVTHNMQQAARISDQTAFMLRESMDEPGAPHRGRRDQGDVHDAARQAHRVLHHRPVRVGAGRARRDPFRHRFKPAHTNAPLGNPERGVQLSGRDRMGGAASPNAQEAPEGG